MAPRPSHEDAPQRAAAWGVAASQRCVVVAVRRDRVEQALARHARHRGRLLRCERADDGLEHVPVRERRGEVAAARLDGRQHEVVRERPQEAAEQHDCGLPPGRGLQRRHVLENEGNQQAEHDPQHNCDDHEVHSKAGNFGHMPGLMVDQH